MAPWPPPPPHQPPPLSVAHEQRIKALAVLVKWDEVAKEVKRVLATPGGLQAPEDLNCPGQEPPNHCGQRLGGIR